MRRWLPLLLVLLLSLRGLVGEAMAGQMTAGHMAAASGAVSTAQPLAEPRQAMASHDCESHRPADAMPVQAAPAGDEQAQAPEDCPTCASCQVCSSVAMSPAATSSPALPPVRTQPRQASAAYPSAVPALAFKPPRG